MKHAFSCPLLLRGVCSESLFSCPSFPQSSGGNPWFDKPACRQAGHDKLGTAHYVIKKPHGSLRARGSSSLDIQTNIVMARPDRYMARTVDLSQHQAIQ